MQLNRRKKTKQKNEKQKSLGFITYRICVFLFHTAHIFVGAPLHEHCTPSLHTPCAPEMIIQYCVFFRSALAV